MNTRSLKIVCLLLCVLVSCLITLPAAFSENIKVADLKGDVRVMTEGQANWAAVKKDLSLKPGDRIKTGEKSACDIHLGGNLIGVFENSEVIIAGKGSEKLRIIDAKVYAKINSIPKGSSFEIRTPTAVCGARGTGVGVDADQNNTTASAFEHDIYVQNANGQEFDISEGNQRTIGDDGTVSDETVIPDEEETAFDSWEAAQTSGTEDDSGYELGSSDDDLSVGNDEDLDLQEKEEVTSEDSQQQEPEPEQEQPEKGLY